MFKILTNCLVPLMKYEGKQYCILFQRCNISGRRDFHNLFNLRTEKNTHVNAIPTEGS